MSEPVSMFLATKELVAPDPAIERDRKVEVLLAEIGDLETKAAVEVKASQASERRLHAIGYRLTVARSNLALLVDRR